MTVDGTTWREIIASVKNSILSIHIDRVRAFEDEWCATSQATGFVVDAERGIVLTNRHVIGVGPVSAFGTFSNQREVLLQPLYRDPIHDFGFFKYDPSQLEGVVPRELPLCPEAATQGEEIRVIGNDAGESFSILSGTLGRLEHPAPRYGFGKYFDFNTFYFQSGSMTSGGSSGAPVIDSKGRVVALNAGGKTDAASAYFLPIEKVKAALHSLQAEEEIPRGTLHVLFELKSFDELKRRLVPPAVLEKAQAMDPEITGLLVADKVLPGTAFSDLIVTGDVIVKVGDTAILNFQILEQELDQAVGKKVELEICRNGEIIKVSVEVEDMHKVVPASFIEIGGAVFQPVSYVYGWSLLKGVGGVMVADPGYLFDGTGVSKGSYICSFAGKQINSLDDVVAALRDVKQGAQVSVRYVHYEMSSAEKSDVLTFNHQWFRNFYWNRQDRPEAWERTEIECNSEKSEQGPYTIVYPDQALPQLNEVQSSLVHIRFQAPYNVADIGRYEPSFGTGIVVDAKEGLVVTDRATAWHSLSDVTLIFAGSFEVSARVVALHPLHNLALLKYSVSSIQNNAVKAITMASDQLEVGEQIGIVGFNSSGVLNSRHCRISQIHSVSQRLTKGEFFQDTNIDIARINQHGLEFNGAMLNVHGQCIGLWSYFYFKEQNRAEFAEGGICVSYVKDLVKLYREKSAFYWPEVEFRPIPVARARSLGVAEEECEKLVSSDKSGRNQVMQIGKISPKSVWTEDVMVGDLILDVGGIAPVNHRLLENALQQEKVAITLWREGEICKLELPGQSQETFVVDHLMIWCGAILHNPHVELSRLGCIKTRGVYVASSSYGSPAYRYGIYFGCQIVEMNNEPTPDLQAFKKVVEQIPGDTESIVVRVTDSVGITDNIITLRPNAHLWPTLEMSRDEEGVWTKSH